MPSVAMATKCPLLAPPSSFDALPRRSHKFQDVSDRFLLSAVDRNYNKQFASLYVKRLETVGPKLTEIAARKWEVPVKKLYQIQNAGRCVLVGTLHRRMTLRPSILAEVSEDYHLQPPMPPRKRFAADETDALSIEDEVQRIPLTGNIDVRDFVTGVTIAVVGEEAKDESGRFVVEDYLTLGQRSDLSTPSFLETRPGAAASKDSEERAPLLLLVSGLNFGGKNPDAIFSRDMLSEFITGDAGDPSLQMKSSQIVRVIVAGNTISKDTQEKDWAMGQKFRQKRTNQESLDAVKAADEWLRPLTASVDLDLLPGESDPATFLWPQQPLHACLFPESGRGTGFHTRPNPFYAFVADRFVLGTSGQNVANVLKCSTIEDPLETLRLTLNWRHVAPTAPDTLGCYPFLDRDPFVIESAPDVYFAGNCDKFSSCWVPGDTGRGSEGTLCVTVPDFTKSKTAVLVDLRTLTCSSVSFEDLEFPEEEN